MSFYPDHTLTSVATEVSPRMSEAYQLEAAGALCFNMVARDYTRVVLTAIRLFEFCECWLICLFTASVADLALSVLS